MVAAYKNRKSMEALAKRVKPGDNPDANQLHFEMSKKLQSRLNTLKYACIGVAATIGVAVVGGVLHTTGTLDLGTVGQVLDQS